LDADDAILHRETPEDEYVPYIPIWARADLLERLHNEYGHGNETTLFDLTRTRGWWPTIRKDVRYYVRHCPQCQIASRGNERQRTEEMHPSHQWTGRVQPFDRWGLDLIGRLPKMSNGNQWIISAVDYATAWPVAKAVPKADAETIADFLHDEIYLYYGAPKEIITDRGPNLWAPAMEAYVSKLNLKHRGMTPFHP